MFTINVPIVTVCVKLLMSSHKLSRVRFLFFHPIDKLNSCLQCVFTAVSEPINGL